MAGAGGNPHVVVQNIQAAKSRMGRLDSGLDLFFFAHIERQRDGFTARLGDHVRGFFGGFQPSIGDGDPRTRPSKGQGGGSAITNGCSGRLSATHNQRCAVI